MTTCIINAKDMFDYYQTILREYQRLSGNLRFNRHAVSITDLVRQYYCEKSLELDNKFPLQPTEHMKRGTEGHTNVMSLIPAISAQEAIRSALSSRTQALCIHEFRIGWRHNNVPILGKIDEVWFTEGVVNMVAEYKFSTSLRPYRTHHVQLGLYCLGLGAMGFDISLCRYTILTFKRACVDCHQLLLRACPILGNDISNFQCNLGRAKSFCFPFNLDRAVCDLNWALEFWTGVRQSTATTNPRKCIVCRHSEYCHSSLA